MTQEELAKKSNISLRTLGDYENEKSDLTITKLLKISEILDCNFWELVKVKDLTNVNSLINSKDGESEISGAINLLPIELQVSVLKSYIIESRKTIETLQSDKINQLRQNFTDLEEYVFNNIALLVGKNQANEYRDRLLKKRESNSDSEQIG